MRDALPGNGQGAADVWECRDKIVKCTETLTGDDKPGDDKRGKISTNLECGGWSSSTHETRDWMSYEQLRCVKHK